MNRPNHRMTSAPGTKSGKRPEPKKAGRPKGAVKLAGQSLRFALLCAEGLSPGVAVRQAGYRVKPGALIRKPHIAEAIRVLRLLDAELRRIIGSSLEG